MTVVDLLLPAHLRRSVARRLLVPIIAFYLLATITLSALQMWFEYRDAAKQVENTIAGLIDSQYEGISLSLWALEKEQLRAQLRGLARHSELMGAAIWETDGSLYLESHDGAAPPQVPEDGSRWQLRTIEYSQDGRVYRLGTVGTERSPDAVALRLRTSFTFIVLNAGLKSVAMWLILVWAANRFLRQPLQRLAAQTRSIEPTEMSPLPEDPTFEGEDEISNLRQDFNALIERFAQNRNELRLILDTIPAFVWYKDDKNNILRVNQAAADSVGMKVEELEMRATKDVFPEVADAFYADDLQVLESGKPKLGYLEAYTNDAGKTSWVRTDKMPFNHPDGSRGVLAIAFDVTETMRQSEALAASEERYQLAVQGASVGIWDWADTSEPDQEWSPILYQLIGYEKGSLSASRDTFLELIHPDDREAEATAMAAALCGNESYSVEYRLRTATGEYRWCYGRAAVRSTMEDTPQRVVGSIQDIQERRSQAQALKDANQFLEASNRELKNFAHITAHDLREPIRSIYSFVQLLRDDYSEKLDDAGKEYINFALDGADRLRLLIKSLYSYCQVDVQDFMKAPIRLNDVLDAVVKDTSQFAAETRAEITLPSTDVVFEGDYASLCLLYQNLINNALKYRSEDAPKIVITHWYAAGEKLHEGLAPDRQFLVVQVTDNGIGIRPAYHKKIFAIFSKLHPGSQYAGSGIGLALCEKIVARHGGAIWLSSEEGEGSSFFTAFPIERKQ